MFKVNSKMTFENWLHAFLTIKKQSMVGRLSINVLVTCCSLHCSIFFCQATVSWLFISIPFVRECISCICGGWRWPEWDISPIQYSFVIPFPISSRLSPSCQGKVKHAAGSLIHFTLPSPVPWICSIVWFSSYCVLQTCNTWTGTPEMQSGLPGSLNLGLGSCEDTKSCW